MPNQLEGKKKTTPYEDDSLGRWLRPCRITYNTRSVFLNAMDLPAIPQFPAVRDALVFVFTGADLASGSLSIIFYGKTGLL